MQKIKYYIEKYPVACITLVFLLAELTINPVGNFPLNDDWWYADSYKKLFEDGTQHKIPWGATSLVGQLLLTKPYALIFGFSYTALRFFTLILSLSCVIFIFCILTHHLKVSRIHAFIFCIVFLFGPLFLALSNSYMSDVPFLFFLSGGFYFYFNCRTQIKLFDVCLCLVFFILAILTRQLTIAFLAAIVVSECMIRRKFYFIPVLTFLIPGVVLFCFESWIQTKISNPIYTYVFFRNLPILNKIGPLDIFINVCKRWIHFINYSGFVLFPILIPYFFYYLKSISFRILNKELTISLILYIPIAISMNKFPLGNYLYDFGIGPNTLYDFFTPDYDKTLHAPLLFLLMKGIAYLSSFVLLIALIRFVFSNFPDLKKEAVVNHSNSFVFISCICFYYLAMCCTCAIFDRYIVPFTLMVLLLLHKQFVPALTKKNLLLPLILMLALFSTLGVKDYLNSHRARWEAINILKTKYKALDKDINGGYEHLGSSFPDNEDWYPKWCNVPPNEYMISRQNIKNYHKLGFYTYPQYMPLRTDTIFYLKSDTTTTK